VLPQVGREFLGRHAAVGHALLAGGHLGTTLLASSLLLVLRHPELLLRRDAAAPG